jgi:hypothetical protein
MALGSLQQQRTIAGTQCASTSMNARVPAPRRLRAAQAQATAAPAAPSSSQAAAKYQRPDEAGRFGQFGGKYVPETLIPALAELEVAYKEAMADPAFQVGVLSGWDLLLGGCQLHV